MTDLVAVKIVYDEVALSGIALYNFLSLLLTGPSRSLCLMSRPPGRRLNTVIALCTPLFGLNAYAEITL